MGQAGADARKRELRRRLRQARRDLGAERRSAIDARLAAAVQGLPEWQEADLVLTYLSVGDEVDTRELIRAAWAVGKSVAIPRVVPRTRRMDWYVTCDLSHVALSPFKVEEPPAEPERFLDVSAVQARGGRLLALVPALAFDLKGFRIGYGGGFYDTFLESFGGVSVGLCREAQMSDDLAELGVLDTHDRRASVVVTEGRVIRPGLARDR